MTMEVCFFGTYEKDYPMNRVIIKGLKKNGIAVKECHVSLWEKHRDKHGKFLTIASLARFAIDMLLAYFKLGARYFSTHRNSDAVIVGYIGQLDIIFLRFLTIFTRKKPKIIFVPLVSLYDTAIVDRNLSKEKGFFAKVLFFIDKLSFRSADVMIMDTDEHVKYISSLFSLDENKLKRVWVGADEDVFYPIDAKVNSDKFTALFFGKYIPLHGIEYIIKAAKMLENDGVRIRMVGNGQLYEKMLDLSKKLGVVNVDFVKWIEYNELLNEIAKADVVLGVFGGSKKASRVIPNKVFQAIACRKAVITGETPAIREFFKDREDILFCLNKDPRSLAESILLLRNSPELKKTIEENAYLLFKANADLEKIGIGVKETIMSVLNK
ncbi:MAG: glycosyltransferase family 4 protein [Candidatus Paceibacterota bacterium]|jgi:glycosyltransferase involved in cell wall biosynthesis